MSRMKPVSITEPEMEFEISNRLAAQLSIQSAEYRHLRGLHAELLVAAKGVVALYEGLTDEGGQLIRMGDLRAAISKVEESAP